MVVTLKRPDFHRTKSALLRSAHEQLRTAGRLESVGGFPGLNGIADTVETSAHADSFLATVRDKATRRKILDATLEVQEATRNGTELQEAFELLETRTATIGESAGRGITEKLNLSRITVSDTPKDELVLYSITGKPILRPGNISVITEPIKSRKTALVGSIMAAPMATGESDCLGVSAGNADGKAVVFFDTEQSVSDAFRVVDTARRRAGIEELPSWLHGYALVGWEPGELWSALETELRRARREHGGVLSVILDGVGDMVVSPNDEAEAFAAVRRLHRLAKDFDTGIFCVLHYNPGGEKSRGHLGSQLERKAESVLQLQKADEVVSLWSEKSRGAPIAKSEALRFRYDTEHEMHRLMPSEDQRRRDEKAAKLEDLLRRVWDGRDPDDSVSWKSLALKIQAVEGVKEQTAATRITAIQDAGFLMRELQLNYYCLTESGKKAVCSENPF